MLREKRLEKRDKEIVLSIASLSHSVIASRRRGNPEKGKMNKYRLDELFDLQMGKTPSRDNQNYWNSKDNKWISIADLTKSDKYITETKEYLSDLAVKDSKINIIPANTVVMSFKLSIGKTAITSEPMYSNEAIMSFRDKHLIELIPDYIYYLFSAKNWEIDANKAVKGKTLNKASLSNTIIKVHDIAQQHKIVAILDQVNNLISLRTQQLEQLDLLVKSRFVEIFGDPATNPMKWEQLSFKQAGNRLSDGPFGSNLKSEHYTPSGIRVIRLGNIGIGKFIDDDKSFISEQHYNNLKKYTCKAGEIVIATLGEPNLRACIIPDYIRIAINKADCVHYLPKLDLLNPIFVCQYINCPETLQLAASMIHGQTRARISSGQIAELPIFLPPLELQNQFATFVEEVDKTKAMVKQSLEWLNTLKEKLMQDFFG